MDERLEHRPESEWTNGEGALRVPHDGGGDDPGGPGDGFMLAFVRAGSRVHASIAASAQQAGPEDQLLPYATLLAGTWSAPTAGVDQPGVMRMHVGAAWFTLRSFLKVCAATTPFAREAQQRGEAALQAVADVLGEEATRLEARVEAELAIREITAIGLTLKGGPGSMRAWRHLAELPPAPTRRMQETTGAYRGPRPAAPSKVEAPEPEAEGTRLYDVWFGTNRAPVDEHDPSRGYTNERDPKGTVHYGTCSVAIPRTHKFGSTGRPFWKRWIRLDFADDHLRLRRISPFSSERDFLDAMREEMEALGEDERVVLVYLHGFNTSFEEAALSAAQIGFDIKVPGATAFYSWPSMADVKGYPADIARVEASERQIAEFLTAVATRAGAERVHIIAHSMGNRGFARAIARITSHATTTGNVRFGQILLAAPDIDVDLFNQLAIAYPTISERTTMYVSARDKALAMSSWLQDSDRAGFTPPVTLLEGIDTIEVTNIDLTLLGHGYFAEAAPVLYDIKSLMEANTDPDKRSRITSRGPTGRRYWAIDA